MKRKRCKGFEVDLEIEGRDRRLDLEILLAIFRLGNSNDPIREEAVTGARCLSVLGCDPLMPDRPQRLVLEEGVDGQRGLWGGPVLNDMHASFPVLHLETDFLGLEVHHLERAVRLDPVAKVGVGAGMKLVEAGEGFAHANLDSLRARSCRKAAEKA